MASQRDRRGRLVGQFVNRTTGSSRQGEKFKVVMKGGVRYHDYGGGRLIADKSGKGGGFKPGGAGTPNTPGPGTAMPGPVRAGWGQPSWGKPNMPATPTATAPVPKVPTNTGTPAGAPAAPGTYATAAERVALRKKATGAGDRLNVVKENPRYGQRFDIVTEDGVRYHKYGKNRKFADKKRGPGSAAYKLPKAVY